MEESINFIKELSIDVGVTSLTDEDYERIYNELPEELKDYLFDLF